MSKIQLTFAMLMLFATSAIGNDCTVTYKQGDYSITYTQGLNITSGREIDQYAGSQPISWVLTRILSDKFHHICRPLTGRNGETIIANPKKCVEEHDQQFLVLRHYKNDEFIARYLKDMHAYIRSHDLL
ncbi:MAG: hypothetical protein KDI63_08630 [Gammaproteobacteria bacterium]|nr:hypothetical protein [Gammaproteobacteria bacterium]